VVLATLATVIASQAIITGAYSLTQQAIQLGFLPRMNVIHTAGHERGQIYIPFVNWTLAIATLVAVIEATVIARRLGAPSIYSARLRPDPDVAVAYAIEILDEAESAGSDEQSAGSDEQPAGSDEQGDR